MRKTLRTLIPLALAIGLAAPPAAALREFTAEIGYVTTSESVYGSGLVYGFTLIEGTGRLGLGITYTHLGHSSSWERPIKVGDVVRTYRYEEDLADYYVGILAAWMPAAPPKGHLIVGFGPEIHFLSATKHYVVEGYSQSASQSRLGIGALVRYQRRIEMFGSTSLVVEASCSWMESDVEDPDAYSPPAEGMTAGTLTVGLAFPF